MKRNHPLKYIFISGGVISGIGKGITSASISYLLKSAGYNVVPINFENYLNLDAGTINPIEHGDPYLCEDGTEADMDIGTYEKFLGLEMGSDNFVTIESFPNLPKSSYISACRSTPARSTPKSSHMRKLPCSSPCPAAAPSNPSTFPFAQAQKQFFRESNVVFADT